MKKLLDNYTSQKVSYLKSFCEVFDMKKVANILTVLAIVFGLTSAVSADGGERGIVAADKPIIKPMDGGERG